MSAVRRGFRCGVVAYRRWGYSPLSFTVALVIFTTDRLGSARRTAGTAGTARTARTAGTAGTAVPAVPAPAMEPTATATPTG